MVVACLCWLLCAAPNIFQKSFLWPETLEHQPSADFPTHHFTSPVLKKKQLWADALISVGGSRKNENEFRSSNSTIKLQQSPLT
jgi:hypothetical protein